MVRRIAYNYNKIEYTKYTVEDGDVNIHAWLSRNVGPMSAGTAYGTSLAVRYGEGWRMVTMYKRKNGKVAYGNWVEFADTVPEEIILYFALRWG
jgi:hypothetical protein